MSFHPGREFLLHHFSPSANFLPQIAFSIYLFFRFVVEYERTHFLRGGRNSLKTKNLLAACVLAAALLPALTVSALADMGPKPQITVVVQNLPGEEYYLDLLVYGDPETDLYDNLRDSREEYDPGMLAVLESYQEDGWYPALTRGTRIPMFGSLLGKSDGDERIHTFSYLGVPEDFKVITVSSSGEVSVSREIHRNTFQAVVYYNWETGAVTQRSLAVSYLLQFLMTFLPTALIEGILLLLFRFSLRDNLRLFLLVNLITQAVLTAVLGSAMFRSGVLLAYFFYVPLELAILLGETVAYTRLLKGHSFRRRAAYAITANLVSAVSGWFLLWYEFLFHSLAV